MVGIRILTAGRFDGVCAESCLGFLKFSRREQAPPLRLQYQVFHGQIEPASLPQLGEAILGRRGPKEIFRGSKAPIPTDHFQEEFRIVTTLPKSEAVHFFDHGCLEILLQSHRRSF
jgi:hypothetical protein